MNFIQLFIYLIQIINEIHPCKIDIHPYEIIIYGHIHPCVWIKMKLSFKLQGHDDLHMNVGS
jgi:hypothetical protein